MKITKEEIKIKYKDLYRRQPFLIVVLTMILGGVGIFFILDLAILITDVVERAVFFIFYHLSVWGGFEDLYYDWFEYLGSDNKSPQYFDTTMDFATEMVLLVFGFFRWIPRFIACLAIQQFPVLEEIHINLSWLLVDFSRIARTFFNLLQFTILFILARKLKRRIRKRFDSGTDWEKIKCF